MAALLWIAPQDALSQKKPSGSAKTSAKKTASARSSSKSKKKTNTARRRTRNTRRQSFRAGQQQPAPERYKEIQTALADRGYFQGEPDGKWSEGSAEALKRFQADQNLKADGKLDSLSLIALGLGPKRGLPPPARPPEPDPAAPPDAQPAAPPAARAGAETGSPPQ